MKEINLKKTGKIERLTNKTFKFDQRIGEGWFSSEYFLKSKKIVSELNPNNIVTMQFFQKKDNVILCGTDEVIALLKEFTNYEQLTVMSLNDGDIINAYDTVLTITGPYQVFGFLEGIIDGILARRSSLSTNVYNVVKVANNKPVIFMGDRDDDYKNQQGDGYAAYIGGSKLQSTAAMNDWWGEHGLGTMPHALIQNFGGDTLKAAQAYVSVFPNDNLTCLVDYDNDVINTSLYLAKNLNGALKAVRVDTSESMIDEYFVRTNNVKPNHYGVCKELIFALRENLDKNGYNDIKIVVSGGFTNEKIIDFEKNNVPIDLYGVGNSLLKISVSFTGDCVLLNGKSQSKKGRSYKPNLNLKEVV